jgi:WD40 repeat protein
MPWVWRAGQRLTVSPISDGTCGEPLVQVACALNSGLTWSPTGDKLGFRDEDGKARLLDLSELKAGETLGTASAMAFSPQGDRLAALAASLPGGMTVVLLGADHKPVWEMALPSQRVSSSRSDGVSLAWSPDGRLLACTTGTSVIWLICRRQGGGTLRAPFAGRHRSELGR